jgi:hypothetical protein
MSDSRVRALAEAYHRTLQPKTAEPRAWSDLTGSEQNRLLWDAERWLTAAVEAGIAPAQEISSPTRRSSK